MTFKPAVWYPIAVVLSAVNAVAILFTAGPGQPLHAGAHAALAVAFGVWANRLRHGAGGSLSEARLDALEADVSRFQGIEGEVSKLRQELSELHERIDFAERVLAQPQEQRRKDPEH